MKFYLNFVSPNFGKIEITKPIGFDAYSFKLSQRANGFGRDKNIGAEQIDLQFISGYFEKANEPRTQPNGVVINNLTMCFDEILQAISERGSESKIEFFVNTFNNGLLDISESTTDNLKYFSCSIVQDTTRALIERKKDIKTDVFGFIDTFGNPQIPLTKTKILLKAKPTIQGSNWVSQGLNNFVDSTDPINQVRAFNFALFIEKSNIDDTLTAFEPIITAPDYDAPSMADNYKLIRAESTLTNLKVSVKQNMSYTVTQGPFPGSGVVFLYVIYGQVYSAQNTNPKRITLYNDNFVSSVQKTVNVDETFTYTIDRLEVGESVWVYWGVFGNADCVINGTVVSSEITMQTTSTAVNSVIFGVPYFNFLQQGIKSISGLNLEANDIQTGEFKDQFVFNGNLIRQKDDKPLNFVFKDEMNDLKELNGDYQILDDKVQLLQYSEFYPNIEIGAFNVSPDEAIFERKFNNRFKDFSLEFNYQNFQNDKDESNTIDSVHTEAQFQHANEQVDNTTEVSINHIRDPFLIETMRKDALKNTTALPTDDKIVLLDCVAIPINSFGNLPAVLLMRVLFDGTRLEILGTKAINWLLLGFENGNTVEITRGENIGFYAVLQHSATILELTFVSGVCNFSGETFINLRYPLTNVFLTNRTNEGFDLIEGVESPENFSNLKYTIKRNLSRNSWSSYLATINKDVPNGVVRNTYFKNNGELTTQFQGGEVLTEKANLLVSDLSVKILNKHEITTKIAIGFETAKQLIEDIENLKGFIRILDPNNKMYKIHPRVVDMVWRDGVMEITGEERNESDFVTIVKTSQLIINEVGYPEVIGLLEWFRFTGEYLQIFDKQSIALINPTKFDKVIFNGITYNTATALAIALNN